MVPALTDHAMSQLQTQARAAFGKVQTGEQILSGDRARVKVEVVNAKLQVLIVPLTNVFMFR